MIQISEMAACDAAVSPAEVLQQAVLRSLNRYEWWEIDERI
jgi:hypothetical protein